MNGPEWFFMLSEPVTREELVRRYAERILIETRGNATAAARIMEVDRRTFYRKFREEIRTAKATRAGVE